VFANSRYPFIDVREEMPDLTELVEVKPDEPFILHPGEFVLARPWNASRSPMTWSHGSRASRPWVDSAC
jgi:dCTP deaminase